MRRASELSSAYGELLVDCSENGRHFLVVTHKAFDRTTVAHITINLQPIVPGRTRSAPYLRTMPSTTFGHNRPKALDHLSGVILTQLTYWHIASKPKYVQR
jgi:hypothetical protein